jgi:hypothetical protein
MIRFLINSNLYPEMITKDLQLIFTKILNTISTTYSD